MMENNIKVSIIMPSLNVKEYIEECIESVVNQTLSEIEIICVDAGSSDGTLEILEKYSKNDDRIKLICSDKKSYGHQVNLGIGNSNGEYIGIVETDDYIDERMYETLYGLTDNGACDISKVNFYHFHDEKPPKIVADNLKSKLPVDKSFNIYENANFLTGHPSIWAAIYKKDFLKSNNIKFIEAPGGGWVDNPFLHETALAAKSIVYSDDAFYYYRQSNPNSSTNNMGDLTLPLRRMIDVLDILDKYSCDDENILAEVYFRIFFHIKGLLKTDLSNQKHEVFKYIKEIIHRLDGNIVSKHSNLIDQCVYYKLSADIDENSLSMSLVDVKYLIKNKFGV